MRPFKANLLRSMTLTMVSFTSCTLAFAPPSTVIQTRGWAQSKPSLLKPSNTQSLIAKAMPFDLHMDFSPAIVSFESLAAGMASNTDISSSLLLSHGHVEGINTGIFIIDTTLTNPVFWSVSIMLSIVGLLLAWEETVHNIRHRLPEALTPVLDSMLGEIGGLGFIGLFLSIFVTGNPDRGLGGILGDLSERFLGERELLLEVFEFLHESFFEVGVAFFLVMGVVVYSVLLRIKMFSQLSKLAFDTDGDGEVSLEELAYALNVEALVVDADGDGILTKEEIIDALRKTQSRGLLEEICLPLERRSAEKLLIRARMFEYCEENSSLPKLDDRFRVENYFEQIFSKNLEKIVELSPLTWLPLIPLISILNAVDLEKEIVSTSSVNAALSSGCFITSPWFMIPTTLGQIVTLVWCFFNFWKIKTIQNMLMPTLVRDGENGDATLLPPKYLYDELRMNVNTSPGLIATIERIFLKKGVTCTNNDHEYLFGAAGEMGPEIYRNSLKLHSWACISIIVFLFSEVVARDISTLIDYNKSFLDVNCIGNIDWVFPEAVVFSIFIASALGQLLLTPTLFVNFCTVTSIEKMINVKEIRRANSLASMNTENEEIKKQISLAEPSRMFE